MKRMSKKMEDFVYAILSSKKMLLVSHETTACVVQHAQKFISGDDQPVSGGKWSDACLSELRKLEVLAENGDGETRIRWGAF